jgi:hypothetical protein
MQKAPLHLQRAYDHCRQGGRGFCPRDRRLGRENSSLSPAVTRRVGTVGALVSFQEGSELLQELAGVAVEAKQVERTAQVLGREMAADERQNLEPQDQLPLPSTLDLGIDGTGIPLRADELTGRVGKQPDGSAKTREVAEFRKFQQLSAPLGEVNEAICQRRPVEEEGNLSAAEKKQRMLSIMKSRKK